MSVSFPVKAKDNPFTVDRVLKIRYQLSTEGWEAFWQRLKEVSYRGVIVGEQGSGKTTLLEDVADCLEAQGWQLRMLRLSEDVPGFSKEFLACALKNLGKEDVVLLDGAEQLGWFAWRRFKQLTEGAGGLIVASHRAGRLPTLIECRPSVETLQTMVTQLLGEKSELTNRMVLYYFNRCGGNIRNAMREMYDDYASLSLWTPKA